MDIEAVDRCSLGFVHCGKPPASRLPAGVTPARLPWTFDKPGERHPPDEQKEATVAQNAPARGVRGGLSACAPGTIAMSISGDKRA
jgi:hypothetical protein